MSELAICCAVFVILAMGDFFVIASIPLIIAAWEIAWHDAKKIENG